VGWRHAGFPFEQIAESRLGKIYKLCHLVQRWFFAKFLSQAALGPKLKAEKMLLTMCPATTNNLDPETVSEHFDIIAFQMYSSTSLPKQFVDLNISPDAFAYGAKFEPVRRALLLDRAFRPQPRPFKECRLTVSRRSLPGA
jgi:hypothetical protein